MITPDDEARIIARIDKIADEHYEANIGGYGWKKKYKFSVGDKFIVLLEIANHGDGEYTSSVYINQHISFMWERVQYILSTCPNIGENWQDMHWDALKAIFAEDHDISIE